MPVVSLGYVPADWQLFLLGGTFSGVTEAIAFAGCLQDMAVMSESIEDRAGQPLVVDKPTFNGLLTPDRAPAALEASRTA